MNILEYTSHSEEETKQFAAQLAKGLRGKEKICLIGPFGSGKTTFVRGFVQFFGIAPGQVQSPTFTLVRIYHGWRTVYHVDLYRLDQEEEIFEAGIFEVITGEDLVLIEWADHLKKYYPEECIEVFFDHDPSGGRRIRVVEKIASTS